MATVSYLALVKAEYDYAATTDEELSISEDQQLYVLEHTDDDWWKVRVKQSPNDGGSPSDAPTGLVPASYVTPIEPSGQITALFDYEASSDEEISIAENEVYDLYEQDGDWTLIGARGQELVGFAPTSYLEIQEEEEVAAAAPSTNGAPVPPPPPPAPPLPGAGSTNGSSARASAAAPATDDKVVTWAGITHIDNKKKKRKGTLGVGKGSVFFASDDNSLPVQTKNLADLRSVDTEKGKAIRLAFPGENMHLQVSKDELNAIVTKIEASQEAAKNGATAGPSVSDEPEDTYIPPPPPPPPTAGGAKSFGFLPPPPRRMVSSDSEDSDDDDNDNDMEPPLRAASIPVAPIAPSAGIPAPPPPPPPPAGGIISPAPSRAPAAPAAPPAPVASSSGSGGGKRARAEYDFAASDPEEMSITEGETLYVLDDSSDEWWKVRNERGEEGEVPAAYIELLDDGGAAPDVAGDEETARRLEEEQKAEARKERERLRIKKLEDEARGLTSFPDFQPPPSRRAAPAATPSPAPPTAAARSPSPPAAPPAPLAPVVSPPPQQQASRRDPEQERQLAAREERRRRHQQREQERAARREREDSSRSGGGGDRDRASPAVERTKPSPARVRTWSDKSGAFKVDAEFVGLSGTNNDKIRLHKLNGVVIEVPLEKMSHDDIKLIQHITRKRMERGGGGERRHSERDRDSGRRDRSENDRRASSPHRARPPSATPAGKRVSMAAGAKKNEEYWFDWFLAAGCDVDDSERYARNFDKDRIDESILPDLEASTLRSLGLREGDIIRVRKQIAKKAGGTVPSSSAGGGEGIRPPPTPDKDPRAEREDQMKDDEELARKLQEEMNAGRDGSGLFTNASGGVKNTRRGRPQPNRSNPSAVSFDSITSSLTNADRSSTPGNERVKSPATVKDTRPQRGDSTSASSSGFDDDAWTVKPAAKQQRASPQLIDDRPGSASTPTPPPATNRDLSSLRESAASPSMPSSSKEASNAQALTDAYLESIGLGKRPVSAGPPMAPANQPAPPQQQQPQGQQQYVSPQQTGYYPSQSPQPPANGARHPPLPIPLNQQLLNPLIPIQTGLNGYIPTRNTQSPMQMMPQQTGFVPQQTGFQPQQTGFQQPQPTGFGGYQQPQQTGFPGQSPFGGNGIMSPPPMQQPMPQQQYGGMMQPQPTGYPMSQMSQLSIQPTGSPFQQQSSPAPPQAPPAPPMPPQQQASTNSSEYQPSSIFASMKAGQFAKPDNAAQVGQKYDALRPQPTAFGAMGGGMMPPQQTGFPGMMGMQGQQPQQQMQPQPLQAQPTGFAPGGYIQPPQGMMYGQQTGYPYRQF